MYIDSIVQMRESIKTHHPVLMTNTLLGLIDSMMQVSLSPCKCYMLTGDDIFQQVRRCFSEGRVRNVV